MRISTRGRYALSVMIDLAEHNDGKYIPLKEISERQKISQKYVEGIMTALSKSNLVDALHGKGGGYRLNRDPKEYTVYEILVTTETSLKTVSCLEEGAPPCPRLSECRTIKMWGELDKLIKDFLESKTLSDLAETEWVNNFII